MAAGKMPTWPRRKNAATSVCQSNVVRKNQRRKVLASPQRADRNTTKPVAQISKLRSRQAARVALHTASAVLAR